MDTDDERNIVKDYLKPLIALVAFTGLCVGTTEAIKLYEPQAKDSKQAVTITRIIDGDTVVIDSKTCRMAGIDAPEMESKGRWPEQPGAIAARQYLIKNIADKRLKARYGKPDKYGRQLVTLFDGGKDLNAELVRYGLAWSYGRIYADEQRLAEQGLWGLWAGGDAIEPKLWRRGERAKAVPREGDE